VAILGLRVHAARMKAAATALIMLLAVRGSQCSASLLSVPLSVVARSVVRDGSYAWTTRRGSTMKSDTEPHRVRLRGAYRAPFARAPSELLKPLRSAARDLSLLTYYL